MVPAYLSRRLDLFPVSTAIDQSSGIASMTLQNVELSELARRYKTPLYLYDQATLDQAVTGYKQALSDTYAGLTGITYAGKAYMSLAIAQWAHQHSLWIDCTGAGEIAIAYASGMPKEQILVHGVNKSEEDLYFAFEKAGTIVVDNLMEMDQIIQLKKTYRGELPEFWLRFRPGIAVETHEYTQTGQEVSKFGMDSVEIHQALELGLAEKLAITGLHFHQGSHFHNPEPLQAAIGTAFRLIADLKYEFDWYPHTFSPGGGWGVAYHEDELPHPPIDLYVSYISRHINEFCAKYNFPLPRLQLEPGRSLVARAGLAIYKIGRIKNSGGRRWLLIDGGMVDNPRHALYQARYSALPVEGLERSNTANAWIGGPFCESGDVLIENLALPELKSGEFIAVPVSGAYQLSMASNYNGARKPAVVWVTEHGVNLIQSRETIEDLYRRDFPLPRDS